MFGPVVQSPKTLRTSSHCAQERLIYANIAFALLTYLKLPRLDVLGIAIYHINIGRKWGLSTSKVPWCLL